jgi:methionyl-tRNA formyltransferase
MNLGQIEHIILFGGAPLLSAFAKYLKRQGVAVTVFSSKRHLQESIFQENQTLEQILIFNEIPYFSCPDINDDTNIRPLITETTLGIGLGEVWSFRKDLIARFGGRLLDFMGIRLPRYRGGAHYTWQILRKNRIGCCNLQIINEEMIQGVLDSGEIVKSKEYFFPASARIPQDYFDFAIKEEVAFLEEFVEEVRQGKDFPLSRVQENFSLYFPRLYTLKHGWIDWSWSGPDIELFICAFDDPYPGASTFLGDMRVFLKDTFFDSDDGPFHPFQAGLVYKKANSAIFVATREGSLIVKKVLNENGENLFDGVKVGQRLFTPGKYLEDAMTYSAVYDEEGIRK